MNSTYNELNEIKKINGRGTNLVTLAIPKLQFHMASTLLDNEAKNAACIKSETLRDDVLNAIQSLQTCVKHMKPQDVFLFSGFDVSDKELKTFTVVPEKGIISSILYVSDDMFHTDLM